MVLRWAEVAVESAEEAIAAVSAGANRLELCTDLAHGGLTPSLGLLQSTKQHVRIPITAMVRPRAGNFCYSETEILTMTLDAQQLWEFGTEGLALGVLTEDSKVDRVQCRQILREAEGLDYTFHRAFDLCPNAFEALDSIVSAGFTHVLTSGGGKSAAETSDRIQAMVEYVRGAVQIIAAGGIRSHNVADVVSKSGVNSIHFGPRVMAPNSEPNSGWTVLDAKEVRATIRNSGLVPAIR